MSPKISRRDFLKITGAGAAVASVLTGCGPASRYVTRSPYAQMPEYNQIGQSTYYATTCRECPAGCGIIMRTFQGRAIKAEGNPDHPVNQGKLCSRGLTAVQGLYNPDRILSPRKQQRGTSSGQDIDWDAAVQVVQQGLSQGKGAAFLLGSGPDHLYDLVFEIASAIGAPPPVRYSTYDMLDGRGTLVEAVSRVYGQPRFPYFDMANADVVFSFGADVLEEFLSPLTYARLYKQMRQNPHGRGRLYTFEPYFSMTSGAADDWIPVAPGTEGLVAMAIGRLAAEMRGHGIPSMYDGFDVSGASQASGVSVAKLQEMAGVFANARAPLAIPGGSALGHANGLENAMAILGLNGMVNNTGQPGGIFFVPGEPVGTPGVTLVRDLIDLMQTGSVSTLFIHGVNPIFELPPILGFKAALSKVQTVISFASFPDETAAMSDYVLPDHTALESFGYQRNLPGTDRQTVSAMQPVVVPLYNTRATADVMIAAAKASGANVAYTDEVDFIQSRLQPMAGQGGGIFQASDLPTFWAQFLQHGGYWTSNPGLEAPGNAQTGALTIPAAEAPQAKELTLITYTNRFGDGSVANRPWIQETPDSLTTSAWNSFVLIHPDTANQLGIRNNDIARVSSSYGAVECIVYVYPAIRPDTVAMPFGQGHTALGRFAAGRGSNPAFLLTNAGNGAGDLAFADTRVTVAPTGRRRPLATMENREGVYGEGEQTHD